MKCLLIAAVALLILASVSPALALTQDEAQALVTATGCHADVKFINEPRMPGFNAFYSWSGHILLINLDNAPDSWQRFILYHETGHCLQVESRDVYRIANRGVSELEWDADAYAIRMMERAGYDAQAIQEDVWAWVYRNWGAEGSRDSAHGKLVDRITRGRLNRSVKHVES